MDEADHEKGKATFHIKYYDCNRTKGTGGRLIEVAQAKKCGLPYHCNDHEMRGLQNLESGKKTAVHLRLIEEFNGLKVYW